jgi:excisionase family DNA binding protein
MVWITEESQADVEVGWRPPPTTAAMDPARRRILLTIAETAEQLAVGRADVWRLIRRDGLPVVRIGRLIRIDPETLVAFLDIAESAG